MSTEIDPEAIIKLCPIRAKERLEEEKKKEEEKAKEAAEKAAAEQVEAKQNNTIIILTADKAESEDAQ